MRNKKGFTMMELLAVIVILGILSTLAVVAVSGYLKQGYDATYTDFEKTLEGAAENALITSASYLPSVGNSRVIDANWLICHDFMEELRDPKDNSKNCHENSYVIVKRGTDVGFNMDITYDVCLQCGSYQSEACKQSIDNIPRVSANQECDDVINE